MSVRVLHMRGLYAAAHTPRLELMDLLGEPQSGLTLFVQSKTEQR